MKKALLISLVALTLSACTGLSDKDRAALEQAQTEAHQAAQDAAAARADADKAAAAAERASEKANRIFRQNQNK